MEIPGLWTHTIMAEKERYPLPPESSPLLSHSRLSLDVSISYVPTARSPLSGLRPFKFCSNWFAVSARPISCRRQWRSELFTIGERHRWLCLSWGAVKLPAVNIMHRTVVGLRFLSAGRDLRLVLVSLEGSFCTNTDCGASASLCNCFLDKSH